MPLVVKRKIHETWRDAVAKRSGEFDLEQQCLRSFEAHLLDGKHEAEAAFFSLAQFDCLYMVSDGPVPGRREAI
ncbi:MAG: hypothetical protein ACJ8DK_02325 [Microvirga sp.]|jgi:hypothetical protein|nr:hypothetical protein [Beijerinckiaceae bacterium]